MYKYCVFSVPRARVSSAPWRIFAGRISIFDYWVDWTSFSAGHNSDKSNDFIEGALGHTFMKINLWLSLTLPKETRLCTEILENKQNENILRILKKYYKEMSIEQEKWILWEREIRPNQRKWSWWSHGPKMAGFIT